MNYYFLKIGKEKEIYILIYIYVIDDDIFLIQYLFYNF